MCCSVRLVFEVAVVVVVVAVDSRWWSSGKVTTNTCSTIVYFTCMTKYMFPCVQPRMQKRVSERISLSSVSEACCLLVVQKITFHTKVATKMFEISHYMFTSTSSTRNGCRRISLTSSAVATWEKKEYREPKMAKDDDHEFHCWLSISLTKDNDGISKLILVLTKLANGQLLVDSLVSSFYMI